MRNGKVEFIAPMNKIKNMLKHAVPRVLLSDYAAKLERNADLRKSADSLFSADSINVEIANVYIEGAGSDFSYLVADVIDADNGTPFATLAADLVPISGEPDGGTPIDTFAVDTNGDIITCMTLNCNACTFFVQWGGAKSCSCSVPTTNPHWRATQALPCLKQVEKRPELNEKPWWKFWN
jgi:hypothetical protein